MTTLLADALGKTVEEQEPEEQPDGAIGLLRRELYGLIKHNSSLQSRVKFQLEEIEEANLPARVKAVLTRCTLRSFIDEASGRRQHEDREERRYRPTLEELRISSHKTCKYSSGPADCDGQMEIQEAFGQETVDGVSFDYAFVALQCSDPACKHPEYTMANPKRKARQQAGGAIVEGPDFRRKKR